MTMRRIENTCHDTLRNAIIQDHVDPPFANNRTNPGNGNFTTFLNRCFYSPGRVAFYHKRYQTLFI